METTTKLSLQLQSPAFEAGSNIPSRFTCDGEDISPALEISGLPEDTRSLALILDDPDAPHGTWTHWLVWNIAPTDKIAEGSTPGIVGRNSSGKKSYSGPCPPGGTHRYYFKLYALDSMISLREGATKQELVRVMEPYILATGELMGRYSR
ncbi:YbhB/YbcL family Raf kinase inhibitor-like protein [Botryobacter ruber]|uniref:YbhB/YbcL family Raf kinase inhibitor-like protein n=1 Tax=Botryobacter ruber TaxID=2171629 RepID=UPI000E0C43A7|nr:YbhB/YbcL family Raf kinase inhibitor-like protein [Botryobacter ruber]